nr:hypothetical protein [Candidatus Tectomicrobia bacterium]
PLNRVEVITHAAEDKRFFLVEHLLNVGYMEPLCHVSRGKTGEGIPGSGIIGTGDRVSQCANIVGFCSYSRSFVMEAKHDLSQ